MSFWIFFTIFWTVGYMAAYAVMRPEILFRRMQPHEKPWFLRFGPLVWTEDSANHATEHYKAYVPVGIAIWIIFFLMAVELKNLAG